MERVGANRNMLGHTCE